MTSGIENTKIVSKSKAQNRSPKGKPRKRAAPLWRRGWFQGIAGILVLGMVSASGWWLVRTGVLANTFAAAKWEGIALSARVGLKINEVLVVGRANTSNDDLFEAMGAARGAPILAFDVGLAKERIEKLPWVRSASVERLLPDTVLLSVEERTPLALWQNEGEFSLIDYEGHVILREGLGNYSQYMVVIGKDAPKHTASLMEVLSSQPEIMNLVRAAVRVGGRRWNLRLVGGIDVQLPEDNAPSAWLRLAQYQRSHSVLDRDVMVVDLRLPDRLIVRKALQQEAVTVSLGQET
ncbi:MAG: FtsQ-type POTRA domain-containing protein [Rhodospirillales bacterium]|jgi:cell division protein FtsQ|nr:FtsQ-type POTRA domain-containing protein [Rhodospirillales bacterium]